MSTHDHNHHIEERFEFGGKLKTYSLAAIGIGALLVLLGFVFGQGSYAMSNLLLMAYYFACVCICGAFFCGVQYVAQAGWSASILRIPQAFAQTLLWAGVILVIVVIAGLYVQFPFKNIEGETHVLPALYHWAAKDATVKGSEIYDPVLIKKAGYLNIPFFIIRIAAMVFAYALFGRMLVKYSLNEDEVGGMLNYKKSFKISATFLAILGFTFPLFAFDNIMSVESHWFSTMFGWYNFAAMWVSGLSVMTLVIIYLRKQGYMQWVTESHLHNMGLFMFAFSIFWTYTWFAQFLLQYYANIPEEVEYFYRRWEPDYMFLFWTNLVINFCAPLLVIMMRDSKRNYNVLQWIASILVIGHWLDYYVMIMPGTQAPTEHWWQHFTGYIEVGAFLTFAGLFCFLMFSALAKFSSLIPKKHPFLEESLHHHI